MQARDFATQTMRSVRSKPLESVLIVFVIALSVGEIGRASCRERVLMPV